MGRNGAGKTTLLRVAAGCLRPEEGIVRFDGQTYTPARHADLALKGLFFLPQNGFLSSAFSVAQHFEFFARRFGADDSAEAVERLRLADYVQSRPSELSPGERRRAEIAAVMIRKPRCLLADEPYRGLAPKDVALIRECLIGLVRNGTAVVVTGHETSEVLESADEVTLCYAGTTLGMGTPAAARNNDLFRREYFTGGRC